MCACVCVCVCVYVCVREPFVKTTKMAKRGFGSHVRHTTKLMGVTWDVDQRHNRSFF